MAAVLTSRHQTRHPADAARLHFLLRFGFATTAAFIVCEFMNWQPSVLAPVLTGVLIASLPASPPFKVGVSLVIVMAVCAWLAFFFTTWLSQVPYLLFIIIGLMMFMAFVGLAQAKGQLPLTLLLICFTVVPVVTLTVSQFAGLFPSMLVRSMALAVVFTWIAFAIWPLPSPKNPDPEVARHDNPVLAAALGVAIVLPVMLIYLMFGIHRRHSRSAYSRAPRSEDGTRARRSKRSRQADGQFPRRLHCSRRLLPASDCAVSPSACAYHVPNRRWLRQHNRQRRTPGRGCVGCLQRDHGHFRSRSA